MQDESERVGGGSGEALNGKDVVDDRQKPGEKKKLPSSPVVVVVVVEDRLAQVSCAAHHLACKGTHVADQTWRYRCSDPDRPCCFSVHWE